MDELTIYEWEELANIWKTGIGALDAKVKEFGVSMPEVMLRAKEENWGPRQSQLVFEENEIVPGDYDTIITAYRTTMWKMKHMVDALLDALMSNANMDMKTAALDTLSKIITRIMPLTVSVSEVLQDCDDKEIQALIKKKQLEAVKKGDARTLIFMGQQYLGQKEKLDIFTKEINSSMTPADAAKAYQEMLKQDGMAT
jgi:hypothetical protein